MSKNDEIPLASGHPYIDRRNSLSQSAQDMAGKPGVSRLQHKTREALHTALAAELQGRV